MTNRCHLGSRRIFLFLFCGEEQNKKNKKKVHLRNIAKIKRERRGDSLLLSYFSSSSYFLSCLFTGSDRPCDGDDDGVVVRSSFAAFSVLSHLAGLAVAERI